MLAADIKKELLTYANPERAKASIWFFKTGKGQYGEGDKFIGITVPNQRKIAKKFKETPLGEIQLLVKSPIHEHRLTALFILVYQFENKKTLPDQQEKIYNFYLKNTKYINNWDLVDSSAPKIIGAYLFDKDRSPLYKLANSKNLWEKRIAILSTLYFIKQKDFKDTLAIAEILLNDSHDLIHKAVGWMLREIGNQDQKIEEEFLNRHFQKMPRTMLRYAIEKFPQEKKQHYLKTK